MSDVPGRFARQYAAALESHLTDPGEAALHQAYELGRMALNENLGVLAITLLHHESLRALALGGDEPANAAKAAQFLAECLSPFEMMLLGFREANARLTALNDRLTAEIAERQRAEAALARAQKLQAIGHLAGGVAHHFNNLLTVMLGNLDGLSEAISANDAVAQRLAMVLRAAQRGAALTKQLLAFAGVQPLKPEVIDAAPQLRDVSMLLAGSLRGDITIATDIPADLWAIEIDPAELQLALLNIGLNARDAMPRGGTLQITAVNRTLHDDRLGLDGKYLVVAIADNGTGIAPEVLPRVFDPFFTTKDVGAGTGLGLSQVHGFAAQSGGAVDIESALGKGTTVRLYLPAALQAVATVTSTMPPAHTHEHATGTVLVVEDDVEVATVAAELIERCGFKVKVAYRARSALDLLEAGEHVDAIFSDVVMPDGMSGIDLAKEVRKRFPEIPVLLTTGYSDAVAKAKASGWQILAKPYRPLELCDSLKTLIRAP
jgi:signal transduction histidine kinase/CheY-like chemotaxis protein